MMLLLDMNLSPRWVSHFAAAGIVSAHWSTIGQFDAPDVEIMAYAAQRGLIVLTHDLDLGTTLRTHLKWRNFSES